MVRKHRAKSFWHKSLRDNSKMCHCHFPDAEQKKTVMTTVFFCEKFTIAKICLLENTQENNEHFNSFEKALKNSLSSFQISLEDSFIYPFQYESILYPFLDIVSTLNTFCLNLHLFRAKNCRWKNSQGQWAHLSDAAEKAKNREMLVCKSSHGEASSICVHATFFCLPQVHCCTEENF